MHDAEYPVGLHGAHGVASATLYCWDEAQGSPRQVQLLLKAENHRLDVLADNYTDALKNSGAGVELR